MTVRGVSACPFELFILPNHRPVRGMTLVLRHRTMRIMSDKKLLLAMAIADNFLPRGRSARYP